MPSLVAYCVVVTSFWSFNFVLCTDAWKKPAFCPSYVVLYILRGQIDFFFIYYVLVIRLYYSKLFLLLLGLLFLLLLKGVISVDCVVHKPF